MTQQRDIERLLDQWFKDGPDQAPDRVVDIVTDRIERRSQRPAWLLQRRPFPVNAYAKIAVAAAAVLIVAVVGYNLLPGSSSGVGVPARSPSAAPTASASQSAVAPRDFPAWFTEETGGDGNLVAGSHTSRLFRPAISLTVPDGWVNSFDRFEIYVLFPDEPGNEAEYALSRDMATAIVVSTAPFAGALATCPLSGEPTATTAADFIDDLEASEGIATTGRKAVTIGGLRGQQIDVRLDPTWTGSCPLEPEDPPTRDHKGVRDRIFMLDNPPGGTVSIVIDSLYAADFDRLVADAMPIVESIRFDVTP